ncbi:hypothetical protein B0H13DRAFT_2039109 [Mycena leptocephala]|nr:hypothetical protein B0H13DRAFT_2039109 [Mycena leptocephala]
MLEFGAWSTKTARWLRTAVYRLARIIALAFVYAPALTLLHCLSRKEGAPGYKNSFSIIASLTDGASAVNCQSEAKEAKVSAVKPSITSATPLNHNDGDAQYRDDCGASRR